MQRIRKRKTINRYDKFSKSFYIKAQKAFVKIANNEKKNYLILDNTKNDKRINKSILNLIMKRINAQNNRR